MKAWSKEKISTTALVLLIIGSIDNVRNLPATALFGSSLIFFFTLSALLFLIPVALITAELASTWPEDEGGIYSWVKHAFGKRWAFVTIWLQWVNTMVWYPTILMFIAGNFAYLINPELAQNKFFLITCMLVIFWSLTYLSSKGIKNSTRFTSFCTIVGMLLPLCIIIVLAVIWLIQGQPMAIKFSLDSMIPDLHHPESLSSLTAIMTSFLGMELSAVHVRNIHKPQQNFPRAMLLSVLLILFTMIFGSLAIAFVLPASKISLVNGVMQAFTNFLAVYHLSAFMPLLIVLMLVGSLGFMINWIIAPAKGLALAVTDGFLPERLYRLNQHGVPSRILLLQAILLTLFCAIFLFIHSINEIYWFFTDLSTELYIMMYVFMFFAAIKLKNKFSHRKRLFTVPGKKMGYYTACMFGLMGCGVTLMIGFFPPEASLGIMNLHEFQYCFGFGMVLVLIPCFIMILRQKKRFTKIEP